MFTKTNRPKVDESKSSRMGRHLELSWWTYQFEVVSFLVLVRKMRMMSCTRWGVWDRRKSKRRKSNGFGFCLAFMSILSLFVFICPFWALLACFESFYDFVFDLITGSFAVSFSVENLNQNWDSIEGEIVSEKRETKYRKQCGKENKTGKVDGNLILNKDRKFS